MPLVSRQGAIGALFIAAASIAGAGSFQLSSSTIKPNARLAEAQVFDGFGCSGKNISPALKWSGAPAGTRSYAVTIYDPDAPGSGWWHWVVYNIPASASEIPQGAGGAGGKGLPSGSVQGRTDFGAPGYGGACPPQGDKPHRYIFTVHALKVDKLDVSPDSPPAQVGRMIDANRLDKASLTATYSR